MTGHYWQEKLPAPRGKRGLRRWHHLGATILSLTVLVPGLSADPARQYKLDELPDPLRAVNVTLRRGDTLLAVLKRFGLDGTTAHAMIETVRPFVNPREIQAGQSLQVILDPQEGTVKGLNYPLPSAVLQVVSTPKGWSAERREISSVRETRVARGIMLENFYQSGTEAGLTPEHILELADIFRYDIDFFSDFRRGDTFSVAFEEIRYADGRRAPGRILAAELTARGDPVNAFYYTPQKGKGAYYDMDGRSLRKAFLRAPLSYRRISSRYSLKRRHPILRTVAPHRAIDYAAATGTPVVSIGGGTITFAGWRKGYGKLVEVRHPNGYTTRYSHLSRIASGLRSGRRVDRGDVIGYVGRTGYATGSNLHFEVLRGRKKINFLALQIRRRQRLTGEEAARFADLRDQLLALLRGGDIQLTQSRP
ncbi:MAG: M23 family metallopeptidase [Candidatus Binatia bacterium]